MNLISYAKINLFLKVTAIRSDNYREIESVFAFLDLYDNLTVEKSDKFSFEINGPYASQLDTKNNIITKILNYFVDNFSKNSDISKNISIKLTKTIPIGAGLGGGSSNAAYFMRALNKIYSLNLSKEELQKISLNFGSDIAFFFEDKASIVKGRGEIIENYKKFLPIDILLINPQINLSTAQVFAGFDNNFEKKINTQTLQKMDVFELLKNFPNNLTQSACNLAWQVSKILLEMQNQKAQISKMSGSGSTCFAIFENQKQLDDAYQNCLRIFPDYLVTKTKILSYV